jgi:hypothetical protein
MKGTPGDPDTKSFKLILDGQQRLTSVYALMTGEAPPFYEGERLYFDIHLNVVTEEFSFYKKTTMSGSTDWIAVTPLLKLGVAEFLAPGGPLSDEQRSYLFNNFFGRLNQLDKLRSYAYYLDELGERDMSEVVKIFDLVNSKGTRLTKSDLALSHICALWPGARRIMRDKQKELSDKGFWFDLSFYVRMTSSVATGSGLYEPLYRAKLEDIQSAWQRGTKALDYLINILRFDAYIDSSRDITSETALIPIIVYLANGSGHFAGERDKRAFLHWLYAALMWGHFSGSTETKLSRDLKALEGQDPTAQLRSNIVQETGRITVEARDLLEKTATSSFFPMTYVVARASGATDWFNGAPLYKRNAGASYGLQAHHIFPQAQLYKSGFDSRSRKDIAKVNQLANLAFLTRDANLKASDRLPAQYLAHVPDESLLAQSVPIQPSLWEIDQYDAFMTQRAHQLAESINHYMERLLVEETDRQYTIEEYVAKGEGLSLEFKGSLRWDYKRGEINKALEKVVAKTMAGFMNHSGGTLLIGVGDDGSVFGLEADFGTLGSRPDQDGWEQHLRNVLNTYLSKENAALVDVAFSESGGKAIAVLHSNQSPKPVYLTDGQVTEFWVRSGNTTQLLNVQQTVDYISGHFPQI